jgi:phage tail tape-measure protein
MVKRDKTLQTRASRHVAQEAEVGLSGAVAGAAVGAIAGPPGALAGAIIGGVVGTIVGAALDNKDADEEAHDAELDEDIGVVGGEIGAPNLEHPSATLSAYTTPASGSGSAGESNPAAAPKPPPG